LFEIHCVSFNERVVNFVKRKYCFAKESFENRRNLKKSVPESSHVIQEGPAEAGCFVTWRSTGEMCIGARIILNNL
jgi:hypothetical protein